MEIVGNIIQVMPRQEGISKSGNPWAVQPFVLETLDQYPRKVYIEIFGDQRIKDNPVQVGYQMAVSYDLESREFNGRWYTSVRAWKVVPPQQAAQPAAPAAGAQAPAAGGPIYPDQPAAQAAPVTVDPFDPNAGGDDGNSDLPF